MLERTKIRKLAIKVLTESGLKVHDSKITSWAIDDLPGISVYISNQVNQIADASSTNYSKVVANLNIEIALSAMDDWSDKLDEKCAEIEKIIINDQDLYDLCKIRSYTTNMKYQSDGEQPIMSAEISFEVEFFQENKPYPQDSFDTTDVSISVGEDTIKTKITINPESNDAINKN